MTPAATGSSERARPAELVMVTSVEDGRSSKGPDYVAGEEPLEIRVVGPGGDPAAVAVTMRTPGNDFELAVGFLLSEGVLSDQRQVVAVRYCALAPGEPQQFNVVSVATAHSPDLGRGRRIPTVSASCGVCGTSTLEELHARCPTPPEGAAIDLAVLTGLPEQLRRRQRTFDRTGGLHAAALAASDGRILAVREDIGRHNAVDKLVGWAALGRQLPLSSTVLVVSGRVSFEIVQKAALAGIPTIVAVSAPSSLAVSTADRLGMTLAGFVRDGRANLYAGAHRVRSGVR